MHGANGAILGTDLYLGGDRSPVAPVFGIMSLLYFWLPSMISETTLEITNILLVGLEFTLITYQWLLKRVSKLLIKLKLKVNQGC